MRKHILSIVLLFTVLNVSAQIPPMRTSIRRVINENTVVKDSTGVRYEYQAWKKLQETGDYTLKAAQPIKDGKPNDDPNMEYILVRISPEQKAAMRARMGKPRESPFFTTGETVKPFKVKDINGNKIDVKDWAGKTVVLNFWFIDCAPCRMEMPELNKVVAKYANNPNVIFIGIALDFNWQIKDFIKKTPYNYQLVGDGREYANLFGIKSYPTNVVINKEGKVLFHSTGYAMNTVEWVEKNIAESDSGQKAP